MLTGLSRQINCDHLNDKLKHFPLDDKVICLECGRTWYKEKEKHPADLFGVPASPNGTITYPGDDLKRSKTTCLHDSCTGCQNETCTGVHMLNCSCPKCTPRC